VDTPLPIDIDQVKGFLTQAEGALLTQAAQYAPGTFPALEIGSYCGRSTVYLGHGCRQAGRTLLALDHHRGSEEHQPGELFHDPELVDDEGHFDTLSQFRRTLRAAALDDTVIPVLSSSARFATLWQGPLALVFIDGGHSLDAALADYRCWAGHVCHGGLLAIHDVYPAPEAGGQAPITVWRLAQASGLFRPWQATDSLRILEKL